MNTPARSPITALIQRFLPRLRYPYLFLILGGLFVVDLVVPDPIPLVDELMLAMLTFLAATLTTRKDDVPPPRDITPDDPDDRLSPGDRGGSPPDSSP